METTGPTRENIARSSSSVASYGILPTKTEQLLLTDLAGGGGGTVVDEPDVDCILLH